MLRAFFLVIVVLCLATQTVRADVADELKICASIEDSKSRLACFDAVGRVSEPEVEDDPEQVVDPETPESMATPAMPEDVTEDFGLDSVTAREREAIERESRAAAALAEDERKALEKAEKAAEKEREKREKEQVVLATITRVERHHDRRFSVTLDNGQIWRETQGSRVGIPRQGAAVELKRGRFGGYRMTIDGIPQAAWVKRTR
jgi:hypothetical protein